jgi:dTDP-4-dehydrorhamnose reductase
VRVLVTGGGGILGTALHRTRPRDVTVVALRHAELDVTDAGQVADAIARHAPDWVIHGAAFTDVDACEREPERAMAVNAAGTANVAAAARAGGAGCVCLSTDYVFDGEARVPYAEEDRTAPQSSYGRSKRAGEEAALRELAAGGRILVVRTQWVFGAGGRNFVDTIAKAAAERPALKVVADQVGCPTWSHHLAQAIHELVRAAPEPGIWHLSADGEASWHEFAVAIVAALGLKTEVAPCTTEEFRRPARRPAYGVLSKRKLVRRLGHGLPHWREGLAGYVAQRGAPAAPADAPPPAPQEGRPR